MCYCLEIVLQHNEKSVRHYSEPVYFVLLIFLSVAHKISVTTVLYLCRTTLKINWLLIWRMSRGQTSVSSSTWMSRESEAQRFACVRLRRCVWDQVLTLTQGGMVMLRLHSTCCASSYLVHFRRKDKKPAASLLLSLTWHKEKTDGQWKRKKQEKTREGGKWREKERADRSEQRGKKRSEWRRQDKR